MLILNLFPKILKSSLNLLRSLLSLCTLVGYSIIVNTYKYGHYAAFYLGLHCLQSTCTMGHGPLLAVLVLFIFVFKIALSTNYTSCLCDD